MFDRDPAEQDPLQTLSDISYATIEMAGRIRDITRLIRNQQEILSKMSGALIMIGSALTELNQVLVSFDQRLNKLEDDK